MELRPIRCGVDTLEATFRGDLEFFFMKELIAKKMQAQKSGLEPLRVCGEELFVKPQGMRLWSHLVTNEDFMFFLSHAANMPPMLVKLTAQGLATRGVEELWSKAKEIASEAELNPRNLTRIDVAVDFQGWTPGWDEMQHVICTSNFRPVYPNCGAPETFQFGKGDVVLRLYKKSKEVADTKKAWWHPVWQLCGYDPMQPVWRVEVQLRGAVLAELGMRDPDTALENINGLFRFGLDWCSLRIPTEDSNKSRWPGHPAWTQLRDAFEPTRPLGRIRPVKQSMAYDACVARLAGLLASAGAAAEIEDLDELMPHVLRDVRHYVQERQEMEFDDLVEEKRRKSSS